MSNNNGSTVNVAAVKAFLKLDANGKADYNKSAEAYLNGLKSYESLVSADQEAIRKEVDAIFDKYKGTNITNFPAHVLRGLNPDPTTYKALSDRVNSFLKDNTGEIGEALLGMVKGAGGGQFRWADKAADSREAKLSLKAIAARATTAIPVEGHKTAEDKA